MSEHVMITVLSSFPNRNQQNYANNFVITSPKIIVHIKMSVSSLIYLTTCNRSNK